MTRDKTFFGFGFGPIQSALFLYEAFKSGNFSRYVVAEIDPELVHAVRGNGGAYTINIARKGRTDQETVRGIELLNPANASERGQIVAAIAEADELATALPSVSLYDAGGSSSVAQLLAEGLARRGSRPAVIYTAENHNHAAEILLEHLRKRCPAGALDHIQVLNTVIGKMSGVIGEPDDIRQLGLTPMTPRAEKAILVEEFNRILVSRIALPDFRRGIEVFIEKDDLLPFEEAKLYGHNAVHALIGFLAGLRGLTSMAQAADHPDIMASARRAFVDESGGALVRKYAKLGDPLFTPEGFRGYAEDLLERMVRPNLNDLVARVTRDPLRKLGFEDRLYGTIRLALHHGIVPVHFARGAAAAILMIVREPGLSGPDAVALPREEALSEASVGTFLRSIWTGHAGDGAVAELVRLTWQAIRALRAEP